jgi:ferredoxin-thioredoxin reductase catalytic subunit
MRHEKKLQDVRAYVENIAGRFTWKLNDRGEMLDGLLNGLMENYNRLGYYNCPCRDSQEDAKLDRDIICPCVYAREADVEEYGHCYCALFFDKEFDMSREIAMIPDRRPLERD